jgi:hypothetical protein
MFLRPLRPYRPKPWYHAGSAPGILRPLRPLLRPFGLTWAILACFLLIHDAPIFALIDMSSDFLPFFLLLLKSPL